MKKNIRIKPSEGMKKFNRIFSGIYALIALGFVVIGVTQAIPMTGLFGIVWTGVACVFVGVGVAGAVSKDGLYRGYRIEVEDGEQTAENTSPAAQLNVEARLKQLEDLREKRLITAGEYEEKRKEILKEL